MAWPKGSNNRSVFVEETSWSIAIGHIDKLIVLHGLEVSDLLDEIWQVLGPGAKHYLLCQTVLDYRIVGIKCPLAMDILTALGNWKPV